jgi:hypothetical protein
MVTDEILKGGRGKMASRWDVEHALVWSNLRPLPRLLMLALATKADVETGVIPDERTPSHSTLAAMTGITRCVVAGHLKYLSDLGWLKISAPAKRGRHDRNLYALMVGEPDPGRPIGLPNRPMDEDEQVESGLPNRPNDAVYETDRSDAAETETLFGDADASEATRSASQTAPDKPKRAPKKAGGLSDRHATTTTSSKPKTKPQRAKNDDPVSGAQSVNAGTILANWIDYCTRKGVKLGRIKGHYAREIKTALDEGFSSLEVRKALNVMFQRQLTSRPSQLPNLLVEMQTGAPAWGRASPGAYQNPDDPDATDDWNRK